MMRVVTKIKLTRTSRRLQRLTVNKHPSAKQASRRAITVDAFTFSGFALYRQGQHQVTLSVSHAIASNTTKALTPHNSQAKTRLTVARLFTPKPPQGGCVSGASNITRHYAFASAAPVLHKAVQCITQHYV